MRPLVDLLERYILAAIGRLDAAGHTQAELLVLQTFGKANDWRKKVRRELGLTEALDVQLVQMWAEAQKTAAAQGATLSAAEFAAWVVEQNFVEVLEMVNTALDHK